MHGITAIVTAPPYAPFLTELAAHPLVAGLRLNTVMPLAEPVGEALARLAGLGKPLYIDLKARQLRVVGAAIPPYTEVRVSHRLRVRTPATAYLQDGREAARVARVDGDRLIFEDGPRRLIGPGESINIPCPTLEIEGTLTATDRAYIEAARERGLHDYMLSFVEGPADVEALRALDPDARVVCKLESARGVDYARAHGPAHGRLMAARGDLFVELARPHRVLAALRSIIARDPDAIAASRILGSLAHGPTPSCADLSDVAWLLEQGYRTLLLGDEVCLRAESVLAALEALDAIATDWHRAGRPRSVDSRPA